MRNNIPHVGEVRVCQTGVGRNEGVMRNIRSYRSKVLEYAFYV